MELNKFKKTILILMLGIVAFLINNGDVYAAEDGQTLCKYDGDFGTIEIYIKYNHSKFAFKWKHDQVDGCGKTVDRSCASINFENDSFKSLDSSYDFGYNKSTGVYVCPVLYYTYEQKNTWTGKYQKKFTFSPFDTGYDKFVTSSIGTTQLNTCSDSTEYEDEYNKISAKMQNAFESEFEKYSNYGYESLKRLLDGVDSNNYGNVFKSIGARYSARVKSINDNIGCKVEQSVADKKLAEFEETMDRLAKDYVNRLKSILDEKQKNKELTEEQARELKEKLEDAKKSVDKAAEELKNSTKYNVLSEYGTIIIDDADIDCEGLLGPDVLGDIKTLLSWIKIGIPVLLILLGSLDFAKAVLSDDPKTLNKSTSTFIKRCIAAVAVFFAPYIIMFLLQTIDSISGGCDIKDLFEGVIMWKI